MKILARRVPLHLWRLRFTLSVGQLCTVGIALTTGLTAWIVWGTATFGAHSVVVRGSSMLTVQEVRAVANVPSDTPLARLDTAAVAERVRQLPEVHTVEVFRSWPNTVRIVITERKPVALTIQNDQYVLVDREAVAFRQVPEPPDLPLVEVDDLTPNNPAARAAVEVAADLPEALRAELGKITAPTQAQVALELSDGRTIFWGDSSNNTRKATVAVVLLDRDGDYMDVSAPAVVTMR